MASRREYKRRTSSSFLFSLDYSININISGIEFKVERFQFEGDES